MAPRSGERSHSSSARPIRGVGGDHSRVGTSQPSSVQTGSLTKQFHISDSMASWRSDYSARQAGNRPRVSAKVSPRPSARLRSTIASVGRQALTSTTEKKSLRRPRTMGLVEPLWWITRGVKPAGPDKDMGGWKAVTFSQEQQVKYGVGETGDVLDQKKFESAFFSAPDDASTLLDAPLDAAFAAPLQLDSHALLVLLLATLLALGVIGAVFLAKRKIQAKEPACARQENGKQDYCSPSRSQLGLPRQKHKDPAMRPVGAERGGG